MKSSLRELVREILLRETDEFDQLMSTSLDAAVEEKIQKLIDNGRTLENLIRPTLEKFQSLWPDPTSFSIQFQWEVIPDSLFVFNPAEIIPQMVREQKFNPDSFDRINIFGVVSLGDAPTPANYATRIITVESESSKPTHVASTAGYFYWKAFEQSLRDPAVKKIDDLPRFFGKDLVDNFYSLLALAHR